MIRAFLFVLVVGSSASGQLGFSVQSMDTSVSPCTDFYQYACGTWMKTNPIPSDQSRWTRFNELLERNQRILKDILETSSAKKNRTAIDQKIGDYYTACMDEKSIEAKGITPLKADLDRIAALTNRKHLPTEIARLHAAGTGAFFTFSSGQDYKDSKMMIGFAGEGGLTLPDRDYYLKTDAKSTDTLAKYAAHVRRMFLLLGDSNEASERKAKAVLAIETELAKASLDRVARRNPANRYHPMSRQELSALTPSFDWSAFLEGIGAPQFDRLNVVNPDFTKSIDHVLANTSLDDIKTYLVWQHVHANAAMLPSEFVREDFEFFGKTLTGAKQVRPRWKRCVAAVDIDLGEALGQKYVELTFGPTAKQRMAEMIKNIETAMANDINELDWMTPATKKRALEKLRTVQNKVGYPDKWRDYSTLEIRPGDAIGNSQRANGVEYRRRLKKIGHPPDLTEWNMTSPTVNAYYMGTQNNINFPAGILQPPFFDVKMDDAVNYGGIGAVIGHEITHGFDDQGRKFDAYGNMTDWWTEQDAKSSRSGRRCIDKQYGEYVAVDDMKINGKLTLGENTG